MSKQEAQVHDFQKSLKKGKAGETAFYELFKDKVDRLDGYTNDFVIKRTGETIELKMETRCISETPNLFIERYSYGDEDGGPWQAAKKKSTYYIHFFPKTNSFFTYRTTKLVNWLNTNFPRPWLINVRNKSHNTRGFVVKRAALEEIELNLEDIL